MKGLLLCVLVLLCSAAYAQEGPACEAAAGECAAACARDALAVVQFACRETPFGLLRSCACGAAPQTTVAESSSELQQIDAAWQPSSADYESDYAVYSSSSSSSDAYEESAAQSDALETAPTFLPRRFGPAGFPAGGAPFFLVQNDPYRAARSAFLADALLRSGAARQLQPTLVVRVEGQQPQQGGVILLWRNEQHAADGQFSEPSQPQGAPDEFEDMDMGAGCAIMTLATTALFVGMLTCCVRACLAACPRRAAATSRHTRQLLIDCAAGELASPLLVVEDGEVMVVQHTKA